MTRDQIREGQELLERETWVKKELKDIEALIEKSERETDKKRIGVYTDFVLYILKEREKEIYIKRETFIVMLKQAVLDLNEELLDIQDQMNNL